MNTPVSFELSKLLKERGFDEPCRFVHDTWDNIKDWLEGGDGEHRNSHKNGSVYYSAPTISEVVMWLYEKHGIWIEVRRSYLLNQFVAVTKNPRVELSSKDSPTEAYESAILYTLKNLITLID